MKIRWTWVWLLIGNFATWAFAIWAVYAIIGVARAEIACAPPPQPDKQAACDLAATCLSKTRRFIDTGATLESQERFIGHCILQGEIRLRRDP